MGGWDNKDGENKDERGERARSRGRGQGIKIWKVRETR